MVIIIMHAVQVNTMLTSKKYHTAPIIYLASTVLIEPKMSFK